MCCHELCLPDSCDWGTHLEKQQLITFLCKVLEDRTIWLLYTNNRQKWVT